MKENCLLSVIVPVYNVEKYLTKCVDSILAQTYTNLQIILVDDGSPDKSGVICDEYTKKDLRVIAIHQQNEGLSGARNNGMLFAKGDCISFVDSDDWLHPKMYETLLSTMEEYQLDIVKSSIRETDGQKEKEIVRPEQDDTNRVILGKEVFSLYFKSFIYKVVWNAVYKRKVVEGILSPDRCQFEDNYVTGRYLYRAERIMIIDDALYYHRFNPNSITKDDSNKRLFDFCICTSKLKKDLLLEGLSDKQIIHKLNAKLARELYHFIRTPNDKWKVRKIHKKMKQFICQNLDFLRMVRFMILLYKVKIKTY